MKSNGIYEGDALEILETWPDDFIDTIITSPPYWGLRDYGIEGQIGLEETLEEYLDKLLAVTEQLQRVLKPTGVMFWNHGDCYGGSCSWGGQSGLDPKYGDKRKVHPPGYHQRRSTPKCLVMQNYRLVLRMMDEQGWILRNTIVWHKPNAMPSSIKDRFGVSHEPIFMLVKEQKYWFDQDAIREPYDKPLDRWGGKKLKAKGKDNWGKGTGQKIYRKREMRPDKRGRNPRDVWKIPTRPKPFKGIHFAVFPEKLVEPMIKATCPEWICKKCGKARVRITKGKSTAAFNVGARDTKKGRFKEKWGKTQRTRPHYENYKGDKEFAGEGIKTVGWSDCGCNAGWRPGIVFDPFMGSGTVAVVANQLRRDWLGVELSPKFVKLIEKRVRNNPKPMV